MLAQTIIFPVLALAASTFASPITPASELAARDADPRCQQGLFIAAPPKEFLYQVQCNTAYSLDQANGISGRLDSFHAFDLIDCALICDNFTNQRKKVDPSPNSDVLVCKAATFKRNAGNNEKNCVLHSKGLNDDRTDIDTNDASGAGNGFDSVVLQGRKLQ